MKIESIVLLAQNNDDAAAAAVSGVFGLVCACMYCVPIVIVLAGLWAVFQKAGKPGWAALVPIYNAFVLAEIVGKPPLWALLLIVPCVNFVGGILACIEIARVFKQGSGTIVGLILLPFVFFPLLGFGSAQYAGPNA